MTTYIPINTREDDEEEFEGDSSIVDSYATIEVSLVIVTTVLVGVSLFVVLMTKPENAVRVFFTVAADFVIAESYLVVPFYITFLVIKRKDLPYPTIFTLFSGFIVSCGSVHLLHVLEPWFQHALLYYVTNVILKITCALVSIYTAFKLAKHMPVIIRIPTIERLKREIRARIEAERIATQRYNQLLLSATITNSIRTSLNAQDIFNATVLNLGVALGCDRCNLYRITNDQVDSIRCVAEYRKEGIPSIHEKTMGLLPMLNVDDELYLDKNSDDPVIQRLLGTFGTFSIMCIRTSFQSVPNGLIVMHHMNELPQWSEDDHAVFKSVGGQVGIAIHHSNVLQEEQRSKMALEKARIAAEKSNSDKTRFLSFISHEIRTPLTSVIGMCNLLHQSDLAETQKEYSQVICDSSSHILHMLNSVLDFNKMQSGKLELEYKPFDIIKSIDKILRPFKLNVGQDKKLEIKLIISPSFPQFVVGDKLRFKQILMNLVSNAVKFTENEGKITLFCTCVEQTATLCTLRLSIQDTGIGIPKEKLTELFQPFHQLDPSISRRYAGTGLGLSIVKQLVDMHKGHIYAESEEGKGSIFHVVLTYQKAKEIPKKKNTTIEPFVLPGTTRILCVDDNNINQKVLEFMLLKLGITNVTMASSGIEALSLIQASYATGTPYQIIFLDSSMPVMSGPETMHQIRRLCSERGVQLPNVVMITGYDSKQAQEACFAAGCVDYLVKPVKVEVLRASLLKIMQRGDAICTQQSQSPT